MYLWFNECYQFLTARLSFVRPCDDAGSFFISMAISYQWLSIQYYTARLSFVRPCKNSDGFVALQSCSLFRNINYVLCGAFHSLFATLSINRNYCLGDELFYLQIMTSGGDTFHSLLASYTTNYINTIIIIIINTIIIINNAIHHKLNQYDN